VSPGQRNIFAGSVSLFLHFPDGTAEQLDAPARPVALIVGDQMSGSLGRLSGLSPGEPPLFESGRIRSPDECVARGLATFDLDRDSGATAAA
jgi:hypothetical protein